MALGNRIQTTTLEKLAPMVVDTVLDSNVLASRVMRAAKKWSGKQITFSIKTEKNSTGGSFAGYDLLDTTATNNRQKMAFDPKFYYKTCSLPLDELSVNENSDRAQAVINLAAVELQGTAQDMADDIGALLYGDGTGNGEKDFLGLAAIVDDGGAVATYGGLSRSTYTTLQATDTASGGILSLAKMDTLDDTIKSGSVKPSLGLTTETVFSLYGQLLQPQERINKPVSMMKGLEGGTGFTGLSYRGFPILADEKCTSGVLFFINERFLDWYALPMAETTAVPFSGSVLEGNDYDDSGVKGLGFSWSGWIKPTNQAALVGHMYVGGELISANPKRHGKLTGITSV